METLTCAWELRNAPRRRLTCSYPHPKSTVSRIPAPTLPRLRPKSSPRPLILCQHTLICHPRYSNGMSCIPSLGLKAGKHLAGPIFQMRKLRSTDLLKAPGTHWQCPHQTFYPTCDTGQDGAEGGTASEDNEGFSLPIF